MAKFIILFFFSHASSLFRLSIKILDLVNSSSFIQFTEIMIEGLKKKEKKIFTFFRKPRNEATKQTNLHQIDCMGDVGDTTHFADAVHA